MKQRTKITVGQDSIKKNRTYHFGQVYLWFLVAPLFFFLTPIICICMPCRFISQEVKKIGLELSLGGVSDHTISEYLGIHKSMMSQVRNIYQTTGNVVRIPVCAGCLCLLDGLDTQVSSFRLSISIHCN